MTVFRWFMRNGAPVLFAIAVFVFVATLAYQLLVVGDILNATADGTYQGTGRPSWIAVLAAIGSALSSSALSFIGACVLDRFDRRWPSDGRK